MEDYAHDDMVMTPPSVYFALDEQRKLKTFADFLIRYVFQLEEIIEAHKILGLWWGTPQHLIDNHNTMLNLMNENNFVYEDYVEKIE